MSGNRACGARRTRPPKAGARTTYFPTTRARPHRLSPRMATSCSVSAGGPVRVWRRTSRFFGRPARRWTSTGRWPRPPLWPVRPTGGLPTPISATATLPSTPLPSPHTKAACTPCTTASGTTAAAASEQRADRQAAPGKRRGGTETSPRSDRDAGRAWPYTKAGSTWSSRSAEAAQMPKVRRVRSSSMRRSPTTANGRLSSTVAAVHVSKW